MPEWTLPEFAFYAAAGAGIRFLRSTGAGTGVNAKRSIQEPIKKFFSACGVYNDHCHTLHGLFWSLYNLVLKNNYQFDSATGVQQGDPLGPALFALAIHGVISEVKSDLNV